MIKLPILLIIVTIQSHAKVLIPNYLNIKITSLTQCDIKEEYALQVYTVAVILDKGKIIVTGSLSTSVDLTPPLKANLNVVKEELGLWIKIPCINGIGSCTYSDLCIHSLPNNSSCPESFMKNNIPCRCRIPKGIYTMPSSLQFEIDPHNYSSVYSGKYYAKVLLTHGKMDLTCYKVYFEIKDKSSYEERKEYVNNYIDKPFVTLI